MCAQEKESPRYSFEVRRNEKKEFYWHLKAANGELIAWSGEEYTERAKCFEGLELVRTWAAKSSVYDYSESGKVKVMTLGEMVKKLNDGEAVS